MNKLILPFVIAISLIFLTGFSIFENKNIEARKIYALTNSKLKQLEILDESNIKERLKVSSEIKELIDKLENDYPETDTGFLVISKNAISKYDLTEFIDGYADLKADIEIFKNPFLLIEEQLEKLNPNSKLYPDLLRTLALFYVKHNKNDSLLRITNDNIILKDQEFIKKTKAYKLIYAPNSQTNKSLKKLVKFKNYSPLMLHALGKAYTNNDMAIPKELLAALPKENDKSYQMVIESYPTKLAQACKSHIISMMNDEFNIYANDHGAALNYNYEELILCYEKFYGVDDTLRQFVDQILYKKVKNQKYKSFERIFVLEELAKANYLVKNLNKTEQINQTYTAILNKASRHPDWNHVWERSLIATKIYLIHSTYSQLKANEISKFYFFNNVITKEIYSKWYFNHAQIIDALQNVHAYDLLAYYLKEFPSDSLIDHLEFIISNGRYIDALKILNEKREEYGSELLVSYWFDINDEFSSKNKKATLEYIRLSKSIIQTSFDGIIKKSPYKVQ